MTKLAPRELRGRIAGAQSEIAAILLFNVPAKGKRTPAGKDLRYQFNQLIRGLIHLSRGLESGFDPPMSCDICGKGIRPGQHYIVGEDITAHAKCAGEPHPERCGREETAKERRVDLKRRIERAIEYLAARGISP